ncbi:MAG: glycosyltransferase [Gemmatimonadales bacterium]|jgi:glycosyltransferase involved in cell wall biosynthesis
MKYLFLHSGREWSGTARAFASAAHGLARRGHSVTFAAEPDSTVERVVSETATSPERPLLDVEPMTLGGTWLGAARRLARLARSKTADVVLVHTDREHLAAAVAYRLGSRARVVRRIRAGRGDEIRRTGRIAARIAPTCYIFATEREAASGVVPHGAVGVVVAPIGVAEVPPQNAADLLGDNVDVVCIHDASSRSRAAAAIRTVAMLAPRHAGLRLIIIGEGIYDDDLKMQAAALGALDLVASLGDRADQIQVMRGARLGWVVADSDTAAYGVLDFMSLGIPVLAPEHTVAKDYVLHDITGVLVAGDDAYMTAAAAAELLTNDAMREAMGAAARGRVLREGTEAAMIDGFERAADLAMKGRRR